MDSLLWLSSFNTSFESRESNRWQRRSARKGSSVDAVDVVKTRRIYSGKMRLQYSTYCVAYGFVVAAVAHVETKVKGSFFSSSLSSFLSLS